MLFLALTAIIVLGRPRRAAPTAALSDPAAVLVIDAGHGGLDGGAVASDGSTESGVNLAIAVRLRDLCRLLGISCAMTRSGDALPYPPEAASIHAKKVWDQQRRLAMINASDHRVCISIHQNYYPDARPCGTQVLYAAADGSKRFAEIAHENLLRNLCPDNRRVAAPAQDTIYLMKNAQCPAILVECGFLSNPAEAEKLHSPGYQGKIAAVLLASYCQYTEQETISQTMQ